MNEYTKTLIIRENGWQDIVWKMVIKHWKQMMRQMVGVFGSIQGNCIPQPTAQGVGNSLGALPLETPSPSLEPATEGRPRSA